MSTTRYLINRQRRLAAAGGRRTAVRSAAPVVEPDAVGPDVVEPDVEEPDAVEPDAVEPDAVGPDVLESVAVGPVAEPAAEPAPDPAPVRSRRPRRPAWTTVVVAALAVVTVLLGGFAALAAGKASALRDTAATGNTALTDTARTSEVKGGVAQDVNAVFSYDWADTARTDQAAARDLTGKAVQQYADMIAQVRAQAPARKLVLTTTVTDTGVQMIDGDRARVLVFADQRNTSTAKGAAAGTTYAAAMFAVDAVRQDGTWKIASIDTFG